MEDEGRTIATRLRRRLSVEADDVSSPSAPSTPTKKRGGRLAAKPVLDNIDENAPVSSPRTTRRRSAVKDVAEEEKAMTPSKRNTRIKSNTSITLETTQTFDSPRARRAARRSSLAGSDTEAPITPVRLSRRTRKDSTSSVENTDVTRPMIQISEESIKEEPESLILSNNSRSEDLTPNSLRKSQRIAAKKDRNSLNKSDTESNTSLEQNKPKRQSRDSVDQNNISLNDSKLTTKKNPDIIEELDNKQINKDSSRRRAKSLTNDCAEDQSFSEAKESFKGKGNRSLNKIFDKKGIASGSLAFQTKVPEISKELDDKENFEINNSSNKKQKGDYKTESHRRSNETENVDGNDNVDHSSQINSAIDATTEFLTRTHTDGLKVNILIDDTDSNSDSKKELPNAKSNGDDQCVPVVNGNISSPNQPPKEDETPKLNFFTNFTLNKSRDRKSSINNSCEPMDIDETMPENVSFLDNSDESNESKKNDIVNTSKDVNETLSQKNESILGNNSKMSSSSDKTISQIKKRSRKSKTPSISENDKEIKSSQSITNDIEKIDNSISYSNSREMFISGNNSILDRSKCDNDIHDKTSDKLLSQIKERARKSKTPSISEDDKMLKSQNISVSEIRDTIIKSKTSSVCEDNKLTDSLLHQSVTDKTMDNSISQLKNKSRKSKTSSVSEENNKSTDMLLSKSEETSDKSTKTQSICLEQTSNDNKTTLILSQLKDESDIDINKSQKQTIKNTSLNVTEFSQSSPLKNKNVEKLGMQTSTPVILDKNQQPKQSSPPSDKSSKHDLSSNDELHSDAVGSDEDSNESLLDNQAEDAGDDYESGDSQSESERRYEEENEIFERGETLTSDEDISDDTDYEKDSFVVSSNEEDNELLSGSGDNLCMSDNELTMSAKSKKKFNERKLKEQKNASREMYNARHGKKIRSEDSSDDEDFVPALKKNTKKIDSRLLESDDESNIKPKKNKQRPNASASLKSDADKSIINRRLLESGDDSIIKPRNNRQRLNSSASLKSDAEESIIKPKNNRFRLNSSEFNDSVLVSKTNSTHKKFDEAEEDEKEIPTFMIESIIKKKDPLKIAIKSEPLSPRNLNISTVNVIPDVEEIHVMENTSILHANETSDPLRATTAFDDDDGDSSSENEEIMQNYNSMLNELNKETNHRRHNKGHDVSLNLNKKNNIKTNPLIDQLNLTQTKKKKTRKTSQQNESNKTISNNPDSEAVNDDSSSNSLDLQLLFPEECDNNDEKVNNSKLTDDVDFIPLKRTEAKTNLQSKAASPDKKTKTLPESKDGEEIKNISLIKTQHSTKKNKNLSMSFNENNAEVSNVTTPDGNKKKSKKTSESSLRTEIEYTDNVLTETLFLKTPGSNKKKNKKPSITLNHDAADLLTTESIKKKKKVSESSIITDTSLDLDNSLNKKKKSITLSEPIPHDEEDSNGVAYNITSSGKQKRKTLESLVTRPTETESNKLIPVIESKNRKRKSSITGEVIDADVDMQQTISLTAGSRKKKLKFSKQEKPEIDLGADNVYAEIPNSNTFVEENKKNKKNPSQQQDKLEVIKSKPLKRKEREDDDGYIETKILKENYSDSLHISRLPNNILDQLEEKSKSRTNKIVSTSSFKVEEIVKRKNKPSHYLEESICLNNALTKKKHKVLKEKPKVLPFMPTASTSESGFTTNFQVNVISHETKFIAQANIPNFKRDYINGKTIRKMGTYEMYRKQRNVKLSKF